MHQWMYVLTVVLVSVVGLLEERVASGLSWLWNEYVKVDERMTEMGDTRRTVRGNLHHQVG